MSVDGINLSNLTHMEALNTIKQSSTDATFRVDYDVSIMGEFSCQERALFIMDHQSRLLGELCRMGEQGGPD